MNNSSNEYCLILAGGIGSRLWPASRKNMPKQFLDIFGTGRTLLQQTYDRFAAFMDPNHIYVSTNVEYLPLVYEQLPQVDDEHILEEPLRRGTLASVAWGTVVIAKANPKASLIVSPADQLIQNDEAFRQDVLHGLDFVSREDSLVVMGVRPTRPETGYGYIQMSGEVIEGDFTRVKTFTEKPELSFAEMFLQDGGFLWNTGLFLFRAEVMLDTIQCKIPEYQLLIPQMQAEAEHAEPKFLPDFFSVLPNLSIDLGILERCEKVFVHACHFGWADLGNWTCFTSPADENGNTLLGTQALLHGCKGNVVRLPQGRIAVIEGLTDYVVAEEGDVLLICPKDRATIRRMMTEAQLQLGVE